MTSSIRSIIVARHAQRPLWTGRKNASSLEPSPKESKINDALESWKIPSIPKRQRAVRVGQTDPHGNGTASQDNLDLNTDKPDVH